MSVTHTLALFFIIYNNKRHVIWSFSLAYVYGSVNCVYNDRRFTNININDVPLYLSGQDIQVDTFELFK